MAKQADSPRALAQIQREISALEKKLLEAQNRRKGVIANVRRIIADHDITAHEIFGIKAATPKVVADPKAPKAVVAKTAKASPTKGITVQPKYRRGTDTWTGRGNQPRWLKAAINGGAKLEDFLIAKPESKGAAAPLDPFAAASARAVAKSTQVAVRKAPAKKPVPKKAAAKPDAKKNAPVAKVAVKAATKKAPKKDKVPATKKAPAAKRASANAAAPAPVQASAKA